MHTTHTCNIRMVLATALACALGPVSTALAAAPAANIAAPSKLVTITLTNPVAAKRHAETIALSLDELLKIAPTLDPTKTMIVDRAGKQVLSQLVDSNGDEKPDQIVFQTDLGPSESKTFGVAIADRALANQTDYKVYGRFVRERHDDFAWENDRVAHRMYGPDLETWKKDPLTSSGVDVWVKRVPRLVVNEWYMTDDYHQDRGEGADFYAVGKSRGCGGLGFWSGDKLHVSKNFTGSRVLANGPIRLVFELTYAAWDVAGTRVSETKRVTLDEGTYFNRFESTFETKGKPTKAGLSVAVGIAKHPGGVVEVDAPSAWMRTWEPLNGGKSGSLGCAIVLPPGTHAEAQQTDLDFLLVTPAPKSGPLTYYVGTAWNSATPIADAAAWTNEVRLLSNRIANPVRVILAAPASAASK